ncbi:ADP-ribose diphosphatase [Aliidiomarina maris]|uniref:ADP-ribose pyrophosphatase n=1 Tax=Aliidiomarina maris TaxID=531312 RepID=A0A327WRM4_9GAMM|nr:ADP-ribose diphosphatase [Aliidiomarina maris]MBA3988597.1 ADP-ribose diphosphatase [Idiomarina sp.]RAJ95258.1 ADP-ribose pyrophosphatase [Aliidiomarina maris]RUO21045.1 ADP-ribose diphosphatase [Aliidiomarina maris]
MQLKFSSKDVKIINKTPLHQGFFKTTLYRLQHKLFAGGWSAEIEREVMDRGHAVVVLPYDVERDQIVMLEQFRVGAIATSDTPWLIELVAGMTEEGEAVEEVARRELDEEAGLTAQHLEFALSYLSSPGGLTERIHIYLAKVDASSASDFGGLASEHEDIRVQALPRAEVMALLDDGKIDNAATVIALQYLALHRDAIMTRWQQATIAP